eukprot:CAMPEP_0178497082 /NCGR_PEP_ID=MMETSP0696-20121128/14480_1 /TAXON_ID=265572 /ORGANISM="Extubocellulus spinifer, Strain CCMP396" /LENGTH=135 /DNA_ID=CAMNT_0020125447 /DNA_START=104 /DNA_END=512 /DNA_ORIENTATION=+
MKLIYATVLANIGLLSSSANAAANAATAARGLRSGANQYNMYIGKACRGDRWGHDKGTYHSYEDVTLNGAPRNANTRGGDARASNITKERTSAKSTQSTEVTLSPAPTPTFCARGSISLIEILLAYNVRHTGLSD